MSLKKPSIVPSISASANSCLPECSPLCQGERTNADRHLTLPAARERMFAAGAKGMKYPPSLEEKAIAGGDGRCLL